MLLLFAAAYLVWLADDNPAFVELYADDTIEAALVLGGPKFLIGLNVFRLHSLLKDLAGPGVLACELTPEEFLVKILPVGVDPGENIPLPTFL